MPRHVVGILILVSIIGGGCAPRQPERHDAAVSQGYRLMNPPYVRDEHYPGGVHVRSDAPLKSWSQVAMFATAEECETSRVHRIDDSIDRARLEVGERAKYELPVRRAVHARCVSTR